MTLRKRVLGLVFFILWASACTSTPKYQMPAKKEEVKRETPPALAVNQRRKDGKEVAQIQELYLKGQYNQALTALGNFDKRYPKSPFLAQARNLHGLIHLVSRRPLQAIHQFKKALSYQPDEVFEQALYYNLASAQYESEQYADTLATLEKANPTLLDRNTRLKFHYLAAKVHQKLKQPEKSARALLAASSLLNPKEELFPLYEKLLDQALNELSNPFAVKDLYTGYQNSIFSDLVLIKMGISAQAIGNTGAAEQTFQTLISQYPESNYYNEAIDRLRAIQNQTVVDTNAVGVLVPMTGRYAKFGYLALQGIQLAFRTYNTKEPDSRVTLYIEDSGETEEQAIQALNRLFFDHHVVAVIGPLSSKGIETVTERANDLGVPLISMAQQTGTTGDYVFPIAVTPVTQSRAIAKYAMEIEGLKKFAIAYPDDKFGRICTQAFWDQVEALGGEITAVETYTDGQTDFREVVDRLSGLHYRDARQREWDKLQKLREENGITKNTRKTAQYFKVPPIVDYEAVFVPDEAKSVGQLIPSFAYQDVDKVRFLGISTWSSNELLKRVQNYADNSVFVDVFNPQGDSISVRKFVQRYESTFGSHPGTIEAMAFDAASLIERLLLLGSGSRGDLKERLRNVKDFPGVTGRLTWSEDRFDYKLRVLKIQNRRLVEVR